MISKYKRYINNIPNWVFWILYLGIGVFVMMLNDDRIIDELKFGFFLIYFILIFRWIFIQTKYIVNLKNEKTKTELLHLKSQVNPHFFFNTLNNLYGLMEKDSEARKMVLKLSDMMRYSIYEGEKEFVSIKEEIDYLENYIELQKMRYHKKSDIIFKHQIDNRGSKIMPLLLIILLENSFKHGLENLEDEAFIHIDLTTNQNTLYFQIENNFEPQETLSKNNGIGLKNLKRRLELAYPKKHSISFEVKDNKYLVKLFLELV